MNSIFITIGLWFIMACVTTFAFEADEHQDLGNLSLAINLADLGPPGQNLGERNQQAHLIIKQLIEGVSDDPHLPPITYGDIVRLVDSMKDNYRLLHTRNSGPKWPTSRQDTDIAYLQDLSNDTIGGLSAAHANQDHFQGRLYYNFWFWHKQAVEVASTGNLWAALLLNAYADHFLQDSFAPGHIIAPRDENSHDLYAAVIHDSCNCAGMVCNVGSLQECHGAIESIGRHYFTSNLQQKYQRIKLQATTVTELLRLQKVSCRFFGDGEINKEPVQPVIMTAYCIQSISDVIKSFTSSKEINSFRNFRWNLRFAGSERGQIELIDVWQEFGDLKWEERDHAPRSMRLKVGIQRGPELQMSVAEVSDPIVAPIAIFSGKNPPIGLSVGFLNLLSGDDSHLLGRVDTEIMVSGGRWDYLRRDFPERSIPKWPSMYALSVGYSGTFGAESTANGLLTRLVIPINRLDLQISAYAGARYHDGASDGWADFEGVRAEWGMQLGSLYLGFGRDHYPSKDSLKASLGIEAGVSLSMPISRLPGMRKSY